MQKKSSKILFQIKNKTFFKLIFRHFFKRKKFISSEDKENYMANGVYNYRFDCRKPRTFNEYTVWIKLNYRNEFWKKSADKLESKKILEKMGLGKYIPKTYAVYSASSEIDLSKLPDRFMLKTNHDSGSVFKCIKGKTNFDEVFKALDQSLTRKYNSEYNEWVYEDIKPVIFAEELLIPKDGNDLKDYKFLMFGGKFGFGFVAQDRFVDSRFSVFDSDFHILPTDFIYLRPKKRNIPKKPDSFDKMMELSGIVSSYYDFVRVDLFDTTKGPMIGELTFFTQSGRAPFTNKKYDFEFGKLFNRTHFPSLVDDKKKLY